MSTTNILQEPQDLLALLEQAAVNRRQADETIATLVKAETERAERVQTLLRTLGAKPPTAQEATLSPDTADPDEIDLTRIAGAVKSLLPYVLIAAAILAALHFLEWAKQKPEAGRGFPSFTKSAEACEAFPRRAARVAARRAAREAPASSVPEASDKREVVFSAEPKQQRVVLAACDLDVSVQAFIKNAQTTTDLDGVFARVRETWAYFEDAYMAWKSYVPVEEKTAEAVPEPEKPVEVEQPKPAEPPTAPVVASAAPQAPRVVCTQTPTGRVCRVVDTRSTIYAPASGLVRAGSISTAQPQHWVLKDRWNRTIYTTVRTR